MRAISNIIASLLLSIMLVLMFFSAWDESAIMDELPHIPAGYSYLTQKDYRLNPEHPPLIKDLAAIPLLFLNLNFPSDHKSWTEDVNGQWTLGAVFLYESGNDPDMILHFARFPIMLFTILFGWLLFRWSRSRYGDKVGLLALFFFTTSPTFLAHGRYVTTDVAAAFGFFMGLTVFIKFLERDAENNGDKKYLLLAGVAFGIAQLLKFSLFMLVPIYFLFGMIWAFLYHYDHLKSLPDLKSRARHLAKEELKIIGKIILIGLIGVVIIWVVYAYHIWNYPQDRQLSDAIFNLGSFGIKPLAQLDLWMIDNSFFRPLGQYFLGLLMVIQRATGGNTAYFLGDVTATGWWYYFPIAYLLKEQLGFHVLTLIALILGLLCVWRSHEKSFTAFIEWMRDNWALTASLMFIFIYWTYSVKSNLNIGVRHVLPTFPFIYLLVSRQIIKWIQSFTISDPQNFLQWARAVYEKYILSAPKYLVLALFIVWMFFESIFAYPYYLSFYNELAGGPANGYKFIVDSNYDWGQDLKRLGVFVEKRDLQKIDLDYFGGGSPRYYFGDKFEPWWSSRGAPSEGDFFAISATFLQEAHGNFIKGFHKDPQDTYEWLIGKEPIARAGTSIFIYKF